MDEESRDKLAEIKAKLDRNPVDLATRFELGEYLCLHGSPREAIPELKSAMSHPRRRKQAMEYLVTCYDSLGFHDLSSQMKARLESESFEENED